MLNLYESNVHLPLKVILFKNGIKLQWLSSNSFFQKIQAKVEYLLSSAINHPHHHCEIKELRVTDNCVLLNRDPIYCPLPLWLRTHNFTLSA